MMQAFSPRSRVVVATTNAVFGILCYIFDYHLIFKIDIKILFSITAIRHSGCFGACRQQEALED